LTLEPTPDGSRGAQLSARLLAVWADRIKASGAGRIWAYFNNDRDGYSIKNAGALLRQLESELGKSKQNTTRSRRTSLFRLKAFAFSAPQVYMFR
jgi:hypothetical protein